MMTLKSRFIDVLNLSWKFHTFACFPLINHLKLVLQDLFTKQRVQKLVTIFDTINNAKLEGQKILIRYLIRRSIRLGI